MSNIECLFIIDCVVARVYLKNISRAFSIPKELTGLLIDPTI